MELTQNADGSVTCEHGTFGALETCSHCTAFAETGAIPKPSEEQANLDEALCRTVRDEILTHARSFSEQREENESKDRVGWSTVAKLYDTALKWHNAASSERMKRGDKEHAEWLLSEMKRLKGNAH